MKTKKQNKRTELVNTVVQWVIDCTECQCENGKECPFCLALILKGVHSEWTLKNNRIVKRRGKAKGK